MLFLNHCKPLARGLSRLIGCTNPRPTQWPSILPTVIDTSPKVVSGHLLLLGDKFLPNVYRQGEAISPSGLGSRIAATCSTDEAEAAAVPGAIVSCSHSI